MQRIILAFSQITNYHSTNILTIKSANQQKVYDFFVIFSLFKYAGTYCSFINHKSFIQPYLSYGNVIYDQPVNASFSNRTDSVQCNMALAIKRAIKDSPCDKLHQELELKYLYKKRCLNRLCLLHKFLSNKQSSHIQKQSPEVFFKKRCSQKFRKIHRKTPVPESLFQPANFLKKNIFYRTSLGDCFCIFIAYNSKSQILTSTRTISIYFLVELNTSTPFFHKLLTNGINLIQKFEPVVVMIRSNRPQGLSLRPNVQKGEGLSGSQFLEGGCWERVGVTFFRGLQFLGKKIN